jgi:hypothetical protein
MVKGIITDKEVKTEADNQEKKINKINSNNKIKKNYIKSSANGNKINNLFDQPKYVREFKIPFENIGVTRNIKKTVSSNISNTNSNINNTKSYSKIQRHKYTNTGLILKNSNISNFHSNNVDSKMKVNTNPNISNAQKISSYNNIPKNKKESVTIRNTVINFNMVNSSLIISSLNKKRHSISNSFHFLNKKINSKKNMGSKKRGYINRTLNNAHFTSGTSLKNNKSSEKISSCAKNIGFKKNKIIINNNNYLKKEILNYSENVAKTENNETSINKIKNKLEKILLNKIKQNNSQEKKHVKYNDTKMEEFNKNNVRNNKIIKKKTKIFTKHNSNLCTTNSIFKSISPTFKNIKTINNSEINSNKLIYVQKQNKFTISSQSANGQKKLLKKMG